MVIYIKLLLTSVLWGGGFIAGRIVAKDVEPFSAAFLRFAVASIFLLILTWRTEGRVPTIKKRHIVPVVLLGMTGIFSYNIFFFKGIKTVEAGRAALIMATDPIFVAMCSSVLFKEKMGLMKAVGIIISVSGAIIVVSKRNPIEIFNNRIGCGEIFIFCAVLCCTAYTLLGKALLVDLSPLVLVFYASLIGTAALSVPAYFEGIMNNFGHYTSLDWLSIFYLGFFGTVVGHVWYYEGIKKIGPTRASLFINFVPISAILLAFFILAEPITLSLLVGAVMVSYGVYLTNRNLTVNIRQLR